MLRSILFLKSCYETSNHYFRHCHYYNDIRKTILHTVKEMTNICLSDFSDETLVNLLLFRNSINSPEENKEVIKASINFILLSRSFAGALIYFCSFFRPCWFLWATHFKSFYPSFPPLPLHPKDVVKVLYMFCHRFILYFFKIYFVHLFC